MGLAVHEAMKTLRYSHCTTQIYPIYVLCVYIYIYYIYIYILYIYTYYIILYIYIHIISGIVPAIERFPGSQVRQDMPAETIAQVDAMTQQDKAIYQRLASVDFFFKLSFLDDKNLGDSRCFCPKHPRSLGPLKHDESRIDHLGGSRMGTANVWDVLIYHHGLLKWTMTLLGSLYHIMGLPREIPPTDWITVPHEFHKVP